MKVLQTGLPGVLLIEPDVYKDDRGFFLETYHQTRYAGNGIPETFVQDNFSASKKNTLRGLHTQRTKPQAKLLRVVRGAIWDVVVDIRPQSETFGRWIGIDLSGDNFKQVYVPPGMAHGFCVLSDTAEVAYKCSAYYDPGDELSIRWNDPDLKITWPVAEPLLSAKDRAAILIKDLKENR